MPLNIAVCSEQILVFPGLETSETILLIWYTIARKIQKIYSKIEKGFLKYKIVVKYNANLCTSVREHNNS